MQSSAVQAAENVLFLGDYCWQAQSNSQDQSVSTVRLGVTQAGGNHFPLSGTVATDEGVFVVSGNAEFTSSGIEAVLHGVLFNGMVRMVNSFHLLLDNTLNGSYRAVGFEAVGGMTPEALTDEDTLTLIQCQ